MIQFIRKIRKKMLSENRISKYLIYALGEIILVVIGILIAIQINNWNDLNKEKAMERHLLTALLQEFEGNLEILDSTILTNTRNYESAIMIGEFTGPSSPEYNEKDISTLLVGAFKNEARYIPNSGTMNEMINSGKMSMISDPELRKAISEWRSQLEFISNQESYVIRRRDSSQDFFIKFGNFRRHLDIIDDVLLDPTPGSFPDNDFKFLKMQEFESNLYLYIVASINLNKAYYLPLKGQTERLIQQIQKNLTLP